MRKRFIYRDDAPARQIAASATARAGRAGDHLDYVTVGNRVPRDYFLATGRGQSDITVHAGSYHLALQQAGIEMCNIITYSSILPAIAQEVSRPAQLTHGSVMETIMATANATAGQRATAGISLGWLFDRGSGERFGGLVCEYNGQEDEALAAHQLEASLSELYSAGYAERFLLENRRTLIESFVPEKRYGTAVAALCFVSYVWPVLGNPRVAILEL